MCTTQLGLGKDYKNLGVGSGKLDGLKKKRIDWRWEERSRARNAVNFMYKYLHLSSKKEVRSAVIGPLRRPSFASFFALLLSGAASILRAHSLSMVRLGRSFLETLLLFMPMITWAPRSYPCFPFSAFESSRNLCTVEDEHETQQVKATIHTPKRVTTTSRVLDLTPRRRLEHGSTTPKHGGQVVSPRGREACGDLDLTVTRSTLTQVTVPRPSRLSLSSSMLLLS